MKTWIEERMNRSGEETLLVRPGKALSSLLTLEDMKQLHGEGRASSKGPRPQAVTCGWAAWKLA
jgi:hypothetical protein